MKSMFTMARMHLTLVLQDRSTYIQAIAVPIVMMVVLSLAINEDNFVTSIPVDVVDRDQSAASEQFIDTLRQTAGSGDADALVFCVYGAADIPDDCNLDSGDTFEKVGSDRLTNQNIAAAVIIPAGFGAALENGDPADIEYRSDEQFNAQTIAGTAVNSAISQLSSSITIARSGVAAADEYFKPYASDEERHQAYVSLREQAQTGLENPPAVVNRESTGQTAQPGFGSSQSVPGMGSMFVMFSLLSLSQFLVEERTQGTLQRLFTVPTAKVNIVVGKILGAFMFGFVQFSFFILIGVVLGVNWGKDPLAVVALIAAFCMAGTALGFLLATFVRTVAQAGNMITLFGLMLAPLGGAWWPLTIVPDFMRVIGHVSPIAWMMDGFQKLQFYNGTLGDVMIDVGALLAFAVVFTAIGIWNFHYE